MCYLQSTQRSEWLHLDHVGLVGRHREVASRDLLLLVRGAMRTDVDVVVWN